MKTIPDNLEIVVLGTKHRPIITSEWLTKEGYPHRIFYSTDYALPVTYKGRADITLYNILGAYRCYRGHQDLLASTTAEYVLAFEDDATPADPNWMIPVNQGIEYLKDFEIISLHGRLLQGLRDVRASNAGRFYRILPGPGGYVQHIGSLAYIIKRASIPKITSPEFNGLPFDLFFMTACLGLVLDPSPFLHDRMYQSLTENPK